MHDTLVYFALKTFFTPEILSFLANLLNTALTPINRTITAKTIINIFFNELFFVIKENFSLIFSSVTTSSFLSSFFSFTSSEDFKVSLDSFSFSVFSLVVSLTSVFSSFEVLSFFITYSLELSSELIFSSSLLFTSFSSIFTLLLNQIIL